MNEIVEEVFQQRGLTRHYSIEFQHRESSDSRPQAYLEGNTLHVIASAEPELRRLIGRFVVRHTWSSHDWLLLTHPGLYTLTSFVLLTTLPFISYLLAYLFLDLRVWIVVITLVLIVVFSIWTSDQVSRRNLRLLRDFTLEMADLNCMTEYDGEDYTGDFHLIAIAGTIISIWGALVSTLFSITFYSLEVPFYAPPLIVLLLAGIYFLVSSTWRSIGSNLCYQTENSEENEEIEGDRFEDNQYLQNAFNELIERMDLGKSLSSKYNAEFNQIRARFSEVKYAQCRGVYDYVEDGTLFIDIDDLNVDAAKRYGAAVLATGSLRFYTELSLKRRAIQLIALFFELVMLMVALIGAFTVSKEFAVAVLMFAGILFAGLCYVGWKQNQEARGDLPQVLRRTEAFKDYEIGLYSNMVFSMSSRFDLGFTIGFLIINIVMGSLILMFV